MNLCNFRNFLEFMNLKIVYCKFTVLIVSFAYQSDWKFWATFSLFSHAVLSVFYDHFIKSCLTSFSFGFARYFCLTGSPVCSLVYHLYILLFITCLFSVFSCTVSCIFSCIVYIFHCLSPVYSSVYCPVKFLLMVLKVKLDWRHLTKKLIRKKISIVVQNFLLRNQTKIGVEIRFNFYYQ